MADDVNHGSINRSFIDAYANHQMSLLPTTDQQPAIDCLDSGEVGRMAPLIAPLPCPSDRTFNGKEFLEIGARVQHMKDTIETCLLLRRMKEGREDLVIYPTLKTVCTLLEENPEDEERMVSLEISDTYMGIPPLPATGPATQ